ncbi:MAG: hypothetical protein KJ697_04715 [Nanoarchaeota archaeon]|nr:hypothetical protein [Nanoarchaeota archaeon]MBU4124375.1 hypothetical protein [Nanoarchaeota archaeon]
MKKGKFMKMSGISLALDDYNDLFSDFDPREYKERALSHDLLTEVRRATVDRASGGLELVLMVPKSKRNKKDEIMIKRRLLDHFRRHHVIMHKEKNKVIKTGIGFTIFGVIVMFLAAYFFFEKADHNLADRFLLTLFEPAGWFLFWEGLGQIVFESKKKNSDLIFYEKMTKCEIKFISY